MAKTAVKGGGRCLIAKVLQMTTFLELPFISIMVLIKKGWISYLEYMINWRKLISYKQYANKKGFVFLHFCSFAFVVFLYYCFLPFFALGQKYCGHCFFFNFISFTTSTISNQDSRCLSHICA